MLSFGAVTATARLLDEHRISTNSGGTVAHGMIAFSGKLGSWAGLWGFQHLKKVKETMQRRRVREAKINVKNTEPVELFARRRWACSARPWTLL